MRTTTLIQSLGALAVILATLQSHANDNKSIYYIGAEGEVVTVCGDSNGWLVVQDDGEKVDALGKGYTRKEIVDNYKLVKADPELDGTPGNGSVVSCKDLGK